MAFEATLVPVPTESPSVTEIVMPDAKQVLDTPEAPATPEVKSTPQKSERESQRFAALAKKEKALQAQNQKIKAAQAEIEAKLAQVKEYEAGRASAKLNPLKALEALGLSYEDVTNFVLNDSTPTPDMQVKSVKDELEAFKKQQQEERQKLIEEEKRSALAEQEKVYRAFEAEVTSFVTANKEKYEYTNLYDQQHLVLETIQEHYEKTQTILSKEQASDLVESYLEDLVSKATETKKYQAKAKPEPKPESQQSISAQQSRTLTNRMTSSLSNRTPARTDAERLARAMAALDKK